MGSAVTIVFAIVKLDCLIPIVFTTERIEAIIACSLSRKLYISICAFTQIYRRTKLLASDIVVVVLGREEHVVVVIDTEIVNA